VLLPHAVLDHMLVTCAYMRPQTCETGSLSLCCLTIVPSTHAFKSCHHCSSCTAESNNEATSISSIRESGCVLVEGTALPHAQYLVISEQYGQGLAFMLSGCCALDPKDRPSFSMVRVASDRVLYTVLCVQCSQSGMVLAKYGYGGCLGPALCVVPILLGS
jgi:hypothetical protein